jgi:hypothetical protein
MTKFCKDCKHVRRVYPVSYLHARCANADFDHVDMEYLVTGEGGGTACTVMRRYDCKDAEGFEERG